MRRATVLIALLALGIAPHVRATDPNPADRSIRRFLEADDKEPAYRAVRRLEAENGGRSGWLEAITEYSPEHGFRYEVTAEGGSGSIRSHVLRAVLDAEREAIERNEITRSSLDRRNYAFEPSGVDADGLANIRLTPRRRDHVLVLGTLFLQPDEGTLVRLQGRLAKSPSFWVKDVDIVRAYERINGAILPVSLESHAQLRLLGTGTMRMTYVYSEVDGRAVNP